MKKRLAIYLTVTFGLAWGLLVPAGIVLGTFENGESSSTTMIGLIAVSMFFPLVGALVANAASAPEDRIDLAWRPLVGQNVRHYLVAWLLPAAIVLLGCVVFYALNPQWFDPTMRSYVESVAAATGQSADQLLARQPTLPAAVASTVLSALAVAPFINTIPAFGEELGWRGMLFPSLAELMPERSAALAEYRARCISCGREVLVDGRRAMAEEVCEDYALLVRYDDGTRQAVRFGEVSVRGLYGYV